MPMLIHHLPVTRVTFHYHKEDKPMGIIKSIVTIIIVITGRKGGK